LIKQGSATKLESSISAPDAMIEEPVGWDISLKQKKGRKAELPGLLSAG